VTFRHEPELSIIVGGLEMESVLIGVWVVVILVFVDGKVSVDSCDGLLVGAGTQLEER